MAAHVKKNIIKDHLASQALLHSMALQDHFSRFLFLKDELMGYQQEVSIHRTTTSLAQQYGLVGGPALHMDSSEWEERHKLSLQRKDVLNPCAICRERFGIQDHVLLGCSHIFHKHCLRKFENYSQFRSCPVCRVEYCQMKVLKASSSIYKDFNAIKIQATFRAYIARKKYVEFKCKHLPSDPERRRHWFAKKLQTTTNHLLNQLEADNTEIDALFLEIDNALASTRAIYDAAIGVDNASFKRLLLAMDGGEIGYEDVNVEWHQLMEKAIERGDLDCSICIMPLQRCGGSGISLLSCSHLFHIECIVKFENMGHHIDSELACPLCRSQYKRLDI